MSAPPEQFPLNNVYRAQVALLGQSGLPEDRYVNTFHFRDQARDAAYVPGRAEVIDNAELINAKLQSFYRNTSAGGAQFPISNYLSRLALQVAMGVQVRVYHHGDLMPREPVIFDWALATVSPAATAVLPNECAATLSYYAGRNIPRSRGRLYIGPLGANAVAEDPARGDMKISEALRATMADAAIRLATNTGGLAWCLYSPSNDDAEPVTAGWVDDALDTQRRRGVRPSTRLTWAFTTSPL